VIGRIRRDVVWIDGPDAATFLQGQVSQDVVGMAIGESRSTLLLQPQGKVASWGRITRTEEDRYSFDVEEGWGAETLARLERFRLRVKAELSIDADVEMVAVRDEPVAEGLAAGATRVLAVAWPGVEGADLVGSAAVATADHEQLELGRIRAGMPRLGAELDEHTIPAEAGEQLIEATVDFTKGCYVGQELVARVDSRGSNTPRRLRRLEAEPGTELEAGGEVRVGGEVVGQVTSAVGHEALAYLKRTVEVPTTLTVGTSHGELDATAREL
jgi:folate-binding protein YgfZ